MISIQIVNLFKSEAFYEGEVGFLGLSYFIDSDNRITGIEIIFK